MMSARQLKQVRFWLLIFMVGLIASGITALPIKWEIDQIKNFIDGVPWLHEIAPGLIEWLIYVHTGLTSMYQTFPFLAVGTDWLAFAHIVIAIAFIGSLRDPVRNVWVIEFGMIACVLVIPTALIFGTLRGLPFLWQLLDCSFGIVGIIPLILAYRLVKPHITRQVALSLRR
jgi:hypothetical protein